MYQRIFIPLDGSKTGEATLPYVEDMVSKLSPEVKVEITLFQVLAPVRPSVVAGYAEVKISYTEEQAEETKKAAIDYLNKTGEALRSKGATVTAKVAIGDASEEIVKAAEEINANLIAMSTHGRSGLSRWAFGSVTDKVLRREGKVPIVMVRALE
jgi:nucleotide-binding universal stress UspA family protein